ncbi:transcription initiation factor IIF, beta subunit-domain-containing protein [Scheffersomyces coipomensis]|uniref:transcription initiation factor IIF, beta subunit-domain-containing protein n=1 Tax=Scheffersomyces coipomensis TaxID=1788519 RepID=UPI00315CE724
MSVSIKSSPSKSNDVKSEDNGNAINDKINDNNKDDKSIDNNDNNDDDTLVNSPSEGADDVENSILSDPEDYLEENESLDMNLTNGNQNIWLVKLPKYLAERWSNESNLNGAKLGTVKIKKNTGGANSKLQVKLVLNDEANSNANEPKIPQEYDISILNTQVRNTYVFSEENLKKFKQELTEVGQMPEQPKVPEKPKNTKFQPRRQFKFFRVQKNGNDGPIRKYIPFVKTIPKKTSLIGKICHDCQIIPSKSDSQYNKILIDRKNIVKGPERPKVTFLDEIPGVIQSNAGPSIRGNNTSVFLKSTHAKKNAEGRAIRMPKKDLLDLLFRLFEEYEYWSMKGLKERTRQPESYLKESLDSIANLIKKGPYTSKYNLKPEFRRLRDADRAVRLGLDVEEEDNNKDNDDEDDDLEMEDVV